MTQYTLKPGTVRDCLQQLLETDIHRTFLYYLCLQQQSANMDRQSGLALPFENFLNTYLKVGESKTESSFFVPFSYVESPIVSGWLNTDLVAAHAPTLLPPASPLFRVAAVNHDGDAAEWSLTDEHWKGARFEFCGGEQVPVESLAAYLFRDYAFRTEEPSAVTVVKTFTNEFGYKLGGRAFSHLFRTNDSEITIETFEVHD
jgi:hypothetical protein